MPAPASQEASRFGLHPALLDAALHAALATQGLEAGVALPFAWSGVQLQARGVGALRVRLCAGERPGSLSLLLADAAGEPVGKVAALHSRPAVASQVRGASLLRDALYRVEWHALPPCSVPSPSSAGRVDWALLGDAPEGFPAAPSRYADIGALQAWLLEGHRAPALVVVPCMASLAHATDDTVSAAHQATHRLLAALQGVLSEERLADSRVWVVTRRAVAVQAGEDVLDLAHAPRWGLLARCAVRAPRSPWPARHRYVCCLAGSRGHGALGCAEPQLGLRQDKLYAPRLARPRPDELPLIPEDGAPWSVRISTQARSTTWC